MGQPLDTGRVEVSRCAAGLGRLSSRGGMNARFGMSLLAMLRLAVNDDVLTMTVLR